MSVRRNAVTTYEAKLNRGRSEFSVPGQPVSKGRPRFGRGGKVYTPKKTKDKQKEIAAEALAAGVRRTTKPVAVWCHFRIAGKYKMDVDNLCKTVLDGLNGIAWEDDDQVVNLHGIKARCLRDEKPSTTIIIENLGELL